MSKRQRKVVQPQLNVSYLPIIVTFALLMTLSLSITGIYILELPHDQVKRLLWSIPIYFGLQMVFEILNYAVAGRRKDAESK